MTKTPRIAASILSADFANLGQDTQAALDAGIDEIHFDVMDHHFVPNLSFGAVVCDSLRRFGIKAPIDVHLMTENPALYFEPFATAGANRITFHPRTVDNVNNTLMQCRDLGLQTGLAFNPDEDVTLDEGVLEQLDMILIMSVFPGFGGQSFIEASINKITQTRALLDQHNSAARLGVDGGIKVENIDRVANAGADFFVVGSGFFKADDYASRAKALKNAVL